MTEIPIRRHGPAAWIQDRKEITISLDGDTARRLEELARAHHVSRAEVVRRLLQQVLGGE